MKVTEVKDSSVIQILQEFGQEMQEKLKEKLVENKAYVSGDLAEQIRFTAVVLGNAYEFTLRLKDYYDYVNKGVSGTDKKRNTPYSYMSASKIPFYFAKQWMNNKGLFVAKGTTITSLAGKSYKAGDRDSQAFAMATSWKQNGIRGNNFYDEVVTPTRLKILKQHLAAATGEDFEDVIVTNFKKIE
jgi:hypothetical protein